VWNKQRKKEHVVDVDDVALGYETKMCWSPTDEWIWSQDLVHEPIVTIETFEAARAMFNASKRSQRRTPTQGRTYLLAGGARLVGCGPRNGDLATVAQWIAEVERKRRSLQTQLGEEVQSDRLTKSQLRALVEALRDMTRALATADADDKAALYTELGVSFTFHTEESRVTVQALPRGVQVRVGGGLDLLLT
jgi:hypothetical protein